MNFNTIQQRDDTGFKILSIDIQTSYFRHWSPISSLGDLIQFLLTIPSRRREWWSHDDNRRIHHEQLQRRRNAASPVGHPALLPESSALLPPKQMVSSDDMDVGMVTVESMMDDGTDLST